MRSKKEDLLLFYASKLEQCPALIMIYEIYDQLQPKVQRKMTQLMHT